MNIIYEFIAYGTGSFFKNERGEQVTFESIKDNFYKLNNRKGKVFHKGYTSVCDHGYSGGYDSYGFVYQDDLKTESLDTQNKVLFEFCT